MNSSLTIVETSFLYDERHNYGDLNTYKEILLFDIPVSYVDTRKLIEETKRVVSQLCTSHLALRSVYREKNGIYSKEYLEDSHLNILVEYYDIKSRDNLISNIYNIKQHVSINILSSSVPFYCYVLYYYIKEQIYSHLLLICHHLVFDGYSYSVILQRDINLLYTEQEVLVSQPSYSYNLYNEYYTSHVKCRIYDIEWLTHYIMSQFDYNQYIMQDRIVPQKRTIHGSIVWIPLQSDCEMYISRWRRTYRETIYTFSICAMLLFLRRIDLQTRVTVGTFSNARTNTPFIEVVGNLVNMIPYCIDIPLEWTISNLIQEVFQLKKQLLLYSNILHYDIHQNIEGSGKKSRVMCNYIFDYYIPFVPDNITSIQSAPLEFTSCLYDLMCSIVYKSSKMYLELRSSNDIFDLSTSIHLIRRWDTIIRQMILSETRIQDVNILLEEDITIQRPLLCDRDTIVLERMSTVQDYILWRTNANPNMISIECGKDTLTYEELIIKSYLLANELDSTYHIIPGDIIVSFLPRSIEMIVAIVCILISGCVYCPVCKYDSIDRLRYICENTSCKVVFSDTPIEGLPVKCINLSTLSYILPINKIKCKSSDIAYIAHTSGSTGRPKGACISHYSCIQWYNALSKYREIQDSKKILQFSRSSFDPHIRDIFITLMLGKTIVLLDTVKDQEFSHVLEVIDTHQVDFVCFTPSYFWNMIQTCTDKLKCLTSIRTYSFIGEPLYGYHINAITTLDITSRILNFYGPVEVTCEATVHRVENRLHRPEEPIALGIPLEGVSCHILCINESDPLDCRLALKGEIGELFISGYGLMRGYYKQQELTDKVLFDHFLVKQKVYRTGDLVQLSKSGHIYYIGRRDFQVKLRGQRIELEEIEKVIRTHPNIKDVIVIVSKNINKEEVLVCYILSIETEENIIQWCQKFLPSWMIPSRVISMTEWPLNLNGKIDRKRLPLITEEIYSTISNYDACSIDTWLLDILEKNGYINIRYDRRLLIYALSSFQLMKIVHLIGSHYNITILLSDYKELKTVIELNDWILSQRHDNNQSITSCLGMTEYKCTFSQQSIYLHQTFGMSYRSPLYTIHLQFLLSKTISFKDILTIYERLLKRYSVFRTQFKWNKGLYQYIIPFNDDMLSYCREIQETDLTHLYEEPIVLNTGPLIRFYKTNTRLLIKIHHIIYDHGCDHILKRECKQDDNTNPISYIDYIYTMDQLPKSEQDKLFWIDYIDSSKAYITLLKNKKHSKRKGESYRVNWKCSSVQNDKIINLRAKHMVSLYTVMMSLISMFISSEKYTTNDFYIGSVYQNRLTSKSYNIWGYLMNYICYHSLLQYSTIDIAIEYWKDEIKKILSHSSISLFEAISMQEYKYPDPFSTLVFNEIDLSDLKQISLDNTKELRYEWIYPSIKYGAVFPLMGYYMIEDDIIQGWFEIDQDVYDPLDLEDFVKQWTQFLQNI
jgi:amino acid adenylation domain-containing protein